MGCPIGAAIRAPRLVDVSSWLRLTPGELLAKLATLIPPPRVHGVRHHGVFAPHSRMRVRVVPQAGADGLPPRRRRPAHDARRRCPRRCRSRPPRLHRRERPTESRAQERKVERLLDALLGSFNSKENVRARGSTGARLSSSTKIAASRLVSLGPNSLPFFAGRHRTQPAQLRPAQRGQGRTVSKSSRFRLTKSPSAGARRWSATPRYSCRSALNGSNCALRCSERRSS